MKKLLMTIFLALMIPAVGLAMQDMDSKHDHDMDSKHDDHDMGSKHEMDSKHDHGKDHSSMGMTGIIMLKDDEVEGVKGTGHLMDGKGGKGKMLMIMFIDAKSGAMVSEGQVALKVEGPDMKIGEAQKMMKNRGMYEVDVNLDQKGPYTFTVGTKLEDGKKRVFQFKYENK